MATDIEVSADQQLRTVQRLLEAAEQARALARDLYQEMLRIQRWESGHKVNPVAYSLGICLGDAEIAANRLGGLRNELQELAETLARRES